MSSKKTFLVDLDGVVIDSIMEMMKFHKAEIKCESQYPEGFHWNLTGAVNKIRESRGLPTLSSPEFWRTLPMYPQARLFLNSLEEMGEVYFATSPTLSGSCVVGKFDWIKEHFPNKLRKFYIGADKSLLARPGSILIDDRDRNVDHFIRDKDTGELTGGQAFLVSRPWNRGGWNPNPYYGILEALRRQQ